MDPRDFQQSYRDALESLQQLQQQLRDDPDTARDVQSAMRDLRQFDPFQFDPSVLSNDPILNQRIQAALGGVEQVEMELRRKVDETNPGGEHPQPRRRKNPARLRRQSGRVLPHAGEIEVEANRSRDAEGALHAASAPLPRGRGSIA